MCLGLTTIYSHFFTLMYDFSGIEVEIKSRRLKIFSTGMFPELCFPISPYQCHVMLTELHIDLNVLCFSTMCSDVISLALDPSSDDEL